MAITLIDGLKQANGGIFALIDSNDIAGGLYHVDTLDEMNILPDIRLKEGMLCYVAGTINKFYQRKGNTWQLWKVGFDTNETFPDLNNKTIIASIKANSTSIQQVTIDYQAAVVNLQNQIDALTGIGDGGDATTIAGLATKIAALESVVGKEPEELKPATGLIKDIRMLQSNLTELTNSVGDSTKGLIKQVNTNTTNITSNTNAISTINNPSTGILKQAKDYVDGKGYATNTDLTSLTTRVSTTESGLVTANSKIDVINGTGVGSITKTVNDSLVIAKSYTDNAVAGMVDSAPETLDTLNELAAALGNDPNFATTIANQIGTKADQSALNTEKTNRENADTALDGKIATINSTLGNTSSGLVKKVNDNATNITSNTNAIASINHATTGILKQAKDYTDTKNTAMNTRVTTVENDLKTGGGTFTKIANLQSAVSIINGDKTTVGSIEKVKSDLTNTIATTVNNLNLTSVTSDNAYTIALKLSDTKISEASFTIETITQEDIDQIINSLA